MSKPRDTAAARQKASPKKTAKKAAAKKKTGRRARNNAIDWASLEREYRIGRKSVRDLAKQFGCGPATITERAKKEGWERDLSGDVRRSVNNKLVEKAKAKAKAAPAAKQEDADAVDAAADEAVAVVESHRVDVSMARGLGKEMHARLRALLDDVERVVLAEKQRRQDAHDEWLRMKADDRPKKQPQPMTDLQELNLRFAILDNAASIYKTLSQPIQRYIELERKAYNLDDDGPKGDLAELFELVSGSKTSSPMARLRAEHPV